MGAGGEDHPGCRRDESAITDFDEYPLLNSSMISPCYHVVSDHSLCHVAGLYPYRTVAEFEKEMDWLLCRFTPLPLEEVVASCRDGGMPPKKAAFISFDDGFREIAEVVAPILLRKGVPATFFLNPDFLDNRTLCYRHKASLLLDAFSRMESPVVDGIIKEIGNAHSMAHGGTPRDCVLGVTYPQASALDQAAHLTGLDFDRYLIDARPYMTSDQVRELIRDGFSVGAHSMDHPRYSEIPLETQLAQTRDSIHWLVDRVGMKSRAFAFPFTSENVSDSFYHQVFNEGTCEIIFCIGELPLNPGGTVVERFGVERHPAESLSEILRGRRRRRLRSRISHIVAPFKKLIQ